MTINFINTKEDNIELNKYLIKNRRGNFDKISFLFSYLKYLLTMAVFIFSIITYPHGYGKNISFGGLLSSIVVSILIYLGIDLSLGVRLSKKVNISAKRFPYIYNNKTVTIEDDYIEVTIESGPSTKYSLDQICKITENKYNVLVCFTGYEKFILIPYSAFRDDEEKNEFLKKLG